MIDPDFAVSVDQEPEAVQAASDELLLLGARLRDETALTALYDRYASLVFTLAFRVIGDRGLAEEAMLDVFLRYWDGQEQYDGTRGSPATWLFGIARQRALNARQQISDLRVLGESAQAPRGGDLEYGVRARPEEVSLRAEVVRAMSVLSERERATIELAYYGGLTPGEIAERRDEPLQLVQMSLRDGLTGFQRALESDVESSATGSDGAQ